MQVFDTPAAMQRQSALWRTAGEHIAFVPTMGALHAGHAALLQAGRNAAEQLVLSIFVNPTQFGPAEDFSAYPRTWDADVALARDYQVDAIFAPTAAAMYPDGCHTMVDPGPAASILCGAHRPGHFRGVATVVLKLLHAVQPHFAYFGEKDYQQLHIVRHMIRDFDLPIDIRGIPTVRETDGLALSSRNAYLSPAERKLARIIPDTLLPLAATSCAGQSAVAITDRIRTAFTAAGIAAIDYLSIVDADTLAAQDIVTTPARLCLAVRIGTTRLIDNVEMGESSA